MRSRYLIAALVSAGTLAALAVGPEAALGTGPGQESRKAMMRRDTNGAHKYFTDTLLVDQNGDSKRFYSDLLAGKVVVINSFYTECTSACPVLMKQFTSIQEALGDRLGQEVHLLSISLDPVHDTPPRVKEYAQRFQAKSGWYFLTGKKQNVDFILRKLGQYVEEKEKHFNLFIIGNEKTGLWKKAFGYAKASQLILLVEGVLNDR